jgi:hypothetical protein
MKNLLLSFLTLFTLSCCSKDDTTPQDKLPDATTTGANTAGCYINGDLLIPKNAPIDFTVGPKSYGLKFAVGPIFGTTSGDDYFAVTIVNLKDKGGDFIYIHLPTLINGVGDYTIGQSNNEFFMDGPNNPHVIVQAYDGVNLGKTFLSGSNAGIIKITHFDYPSRIYSGTFSLKVYKDNPSETIKITDGRFDVNGFTLNQ